MSKARLEPRWSGAGLAIGMALLATPALARTTVDASAPEAVAVTLYRDPNREAGQAMDRNRPQGFAMISETRRVTLPPGESTIRFEGVAEGMVAVTAIVTGLPGGTIEKNRNADLLSPAALVDGTLGNRVTVTRTNPATGRQTSESAVVRTRADGGLVLQTSAGYEAVRCSGLPEKLTFARVPAGLSAQPVFTIDTRDRTGGTYTVQLTYLAWGFDWQAHYVATLDEPGRSGAVAMRLMSWLTLLNDNGQSFPGAQLNVVAGRLEVQSDYRGLADPPDARPLRLTCYPIGHTASGSPIAYPVPPPAPPPAPAMAYDEAAESIVVTGAMRSAKAMNLAAPAMVAVEENLGDLKLYRVPEPVTVAARGLKQVAFLDRQAVKGTLRYDTPCSPWSLSDDEYRPADMVLATVNDREHGLGMALPTGAVTVFEPSAAGDLFVGEQQLRDYAEGQDVDIEVGRSTIVHARCAIVGRMPEEFEKGAQVTLRSTLTNAASVPALVRLSLGPSGSHRVTGLQGVRVKDGERIVELTVPANAVRDVRWTYRFDAD